MTATGTLRRRFFGGPVWVLEPDQGAPIQLVGDIPAGLQDQRVQVDGQPARAQHGLAMAGEIWEVRRIRAR